mgnify:CR=1 FL=1
MSLKDQLLKAGAVDKKKAKQIHHESKNKKNKQAKQKEAEQRRKEIAQKEQEQKQRAQELNKIKNEEAQQKAILAQIDQLIEVNKQKKVEDNFEEIAYSFTDGTKIKQVYVSAKIQQHLSSGLLVIAKFGEGYELIPAKVAEKIEQRDAEVIIKTADDTSSTVDENDPYADYQIPDDLMW